MFNAESREEPEDEEEYVFTDEKFNFSVSKGLDESRSLATEHDETHGAVVRNEREVVCRYFCGEKPRYGAYLVSLPQTNIAEGSEIRTITTAGGLFSSYVDSPAEILDPKALTITVTKYAPESDWTWLSKYVNVPVFVNRVGERGVTVWLPNGDVKPVNFK